MLPLQRRSRPRCRRSSSSFASIGDGAHGWHGAGQRQRALKIAAGRRMFAELSIVFLGHHQKPLSRERVGLIGQIAGPLCQAPVELDIPMCPHSTLPGLHLSRSTPPTSRRASRVGHSQNVLRRACSSRSGASKLAVGRGNSHVSPPSDPEAMPEVRGVDESPGWRGRAQRALRLQP